jgi:hypothetical protein
MSKNDEKHASVLSMDELDNVAGGDARVNNELEAVPTQAPVSAALVRSYRSR